MGCEKLKKCVALHFFIPNICRNKNFIYLCTRKRKQCNNAEVAQLVEHNLAKVRVAGSSPVFRSRPPGWWNGRHEGLKILWLLQLCGFKSRSGYERRQIKVCRLFVFLQYSIKNTPIFTPFTYYLYSIFIYRKHTYFVQKRIYLQPYKSKNKIWIPY